MKKTVYNKPDAEMVVLSVSDVLTASSAVVMSDGYAFIDGSTLD